MLKYISGTSIINDIRLALLASQTRKEMLTRRVGGLIVELRALTLEYETEIIFVHKLKGMLTSEPQLRPSTNDVQHAAGIDERT